MVDEQPKKKFWSWLRDYAVNDVSPMENWFNIISERRPYLKRYQWYISIAIQLLLWCSFIGAIIWASQSFISVGYEELNRSCDQCLARCAKEMINSTFNMTRFGNTTLTLVGS